MCLLVYLCMSSNWNAGPQVKRSCHRGCISMGNETSFSAKSKDRLASRGEPSCSRRTTADLDCVLEQWGDRESRKAEDNARLCCRSTSPVRSAGRSRCDMARTCQCLQSDDVSEQGSNDEDCTAYDDVSRGARSADTPYPGTSPGSAESISCLRRSTNIDTEHSLALKSCRRRSSSQPNCRVERGDGINIFVCSNCGMSVPSIYCRKCCGQQTRRTCQESAGGSITECCPQRCRQLLDNDDDCSTESDSKMEQLECRRPRSQYTEFSHRKYPSCVRVKCFRFDDITQDQCCQVCSSEFDQCCNPRRVVTSDFGQVYPCFSQEKCKNFDQSYCSSRGNSRDFGQNFCSTFETIADLCQCECLPKDNDVIKLSCGSGRSGTPLSQYECAKKESSAVRHDASVKTARDDFTTESVYRGGRLQNPKTVCQFCVDTQPELSSGDCTFAEVQLEGGVIVAEVNKSLSC